MTTITFDPTLVSAHSANEAAAIVRDLHPGAIIDAYDATTALGDSYYDVLVWATESAAQNDDGAHAIARYSVAHVEDAAE